MGNNKTKIFKFFSVPLMKQNIKANGLLTFVIIIIMCMMCTVISFATNMLATNSSTVGKEEARKISTCIYLPLLPIIR